MRRESRLLRREQQTLFQKRSLWLAEKERLDSDGLFPPLHSGVLRFVSDPTTQECLGAAVFNLMRKTERAKAEELPKPEVPPNWGEDTSPANIEEDIPPSCSRAEQPREARQNGGHQVHGPSQDCPGGTPGPESRAPICSNPHAVRRSHRAVLEPALAAVRLPVATRTTASPRRGIQKGVRRIVVHQAVGRSGLRRVGQGRGRRR